MTDTPSTAGQRLDAAATALWGEAWAVPLARLSGVNPRTAQRVQSAIRGGNPNDPRVAGLTAALGEALERVSALLRSADPPPGRA